MSGSEKRRRKGEKGKREEKEAKTSCVVFRRKPMNK